MAKKDEKEEGKPSVANEKLKALQLTLDKIEKSYGKGAVMKLGDNPAIENIDVISTGSIGVDNALGRDCGFHRCRTRLRPGLCPEIGGQYQ